MGTFVWVLTIALVILIHEAGHFLAMRLCGIGVKEFSLGFGPALWQRQVASGTTYSLRVLPIGGYVMAGGENAEALHEVASWPKRLFVYSAGMLANVIVAFLLLTGAYLYQVWGKGLALKAVEVAALQTFGSWLATPYMIFHLLFSDPQQLSSGLMGPVGIVNEGAKHAMTFIEWLKLFIMLHVGIAGINLVPIPALDGGRIAMMPFERLLGRKRITILLNVCAIGLIILMIWITFRDVVHLFQ